jgi:integrase
MKEAFKSGGFLALSPERYERVREHWQRCRKGEGWAGHAHRPWQNRDMLNNLLRNTKGYLRKAGIELSAPFTLHTFRKSFAQNHADAGTPPRTLAKLLGHSTTRVTMEFYSQVTDANEQAAAEAMNRVFDRLRRTKDAV